ncbi:MAG: four-carbon acid sugar kinase family protein [Microvirga sp.]|jgi:uncharacterized protein YgbK (DUF1537 family)|nr:four-carbon acid sugar kinase family protein [Microvirga sp.]
MLIGVIADDFTGASDIASTLAKGHGDIPALSTIQYLGIPSDPAGTACEAGVVSLKSRSIPPKEAIEQSLAALAWLRAQGCQQIVFKYCSTFDSTPVGNIGPVGEALAKALGVKGVVVCPAFPTAGRTVYQGQLFVGDVPLAESSMKHHPLNPMTDSDLRRWLARQARDPVGFVPWTTVRGGPDSIRASLEAAAARGETLVVVDAIADVDLLAIGLACADAPFVTGGSGIALGLAANVAGHLRDRERRTEVRQVCGPEAILAGSCSDATLNQVAQHAKTHPVMAISIEDLMTGKIGPDDCVAFIRKHEGNAPLIYTSDTPQGVSASQGIYGREEISSRIEKLFADSARALVSGGTRRLVVAGGETSGAVVSALGVRALAVGREIGPGVPILISQGKEPLALALKSGNFGQPDFFARALDMMSNPR